MDAGDLFLEGRQSSFPKPHWGQDNRTPFQQTKSHDCCSPGLFSSYVCIFYMFELCSSAFDIAGHLIEPDQGKIYPKLSSKVLITYFVSWYEIQPQCLILYTQVDLITFQYQTMEGAKSLLQTGKYFCSIISGCTSGSMNFGALPILIWSFGNWSVASEVSAVDIVLIIVVRSWGKWRSSFMYRNREQAVWA